MREIYVPDAPSSYAGHMSDRFGKAAGRDAFISRRDVIVSSSPRLRLIDSMFIRTLNLLRI